MVRSIIAIIVAVVTWFVVAAIGNWILRATFPGYSAVEVAMTFTLMMMICRLILGLVLFVVRGLRVRNYSWANYRCSQGSRGNHGYPVPASALHALGQASALVPLVLSDYAGTNDAD